MSGILSHPTNQGVGEDDDSPSCSSKDFEADNLTVVDIEPRPLQVGRSNLDPSKTASSLALPGLLSSSLSRRSSRPLQNLLHVDDIDSLCPIVDAKTVRSAQDSNPLTPSLAVH